MIEVKGKNGISAKVVLHSKSSVDGKEIVTFEVIHHRWVLAEINKHRLFSNNYQSSRAVPVSKVLEAIRKSPAMPVHWGKKQSGMQAEEECDESLLLKLDCVDYTKLYRDEGWEAIAKKVCDWAEEYDSCNYHKQIVNRLTEPFQMIKGVITATELDNFFYLRRHPDAQPELQELADCMWKALQKSTPYILEPGQWHIPYVSTKIHPERGLVYFREEGGFALSGLEEAKRVSAASVAQVSFRKLDQSPEKIEKVWNMLVDTEQPHCYDAETEVLTYAGFKKWKEVSTSDLLAIVDKNTFEFKGYDHPSHIVDEVYSGDMYHYTGRYFDLLVTPNHRCVGDVITNEELRKKFNPKVFMPGEKSGAKSLVSSLGEQFTKMLTVPLDANGVVNITEYSAAALIGFAVGDGYIKNNSLCFRLKKDRKIVWLDELLSRISNDYSKWYNKDGVVEYKIRDVPIQKDMIYNEEGFKKLPTGFRKYSFSAKQGLLDGLRNSDGCEVDNSFVYSTNSKQLKDEFEELVIISGSGNPSISLDKRDPAKLIYRIKVRKQKYEIVNDSRKKNSKTSIVHYTGKVYCASVGGDLLIVRRNGKICVSGNSVCLEHQATPMMYTTHERFPEMVYKYDMLEEGLTHVDTFGNSWSGNFKGWIQHRQLLPNNTCWDYKGDK